MQKACKVKKLICVMVVFCGGLFALSPSIVLDSKEEVSALRLLESKTQSNPKLYVSTSNGVVDIYDLNGILAKKSLKPLQSIKLPSYTDLFDNVIERRIFHTDVNKNGEALIVASNATKRDLFLHKNGRSEIVIKDLDVAKALWIDESTFAVGFVGNEVWIVDSKSGKVLNKRKIAIYRFSDMVLNREDNLLYTTGESGAIYALDCSNVNLVAKFDGVHKDNIFALGFANNILVSGGMDKRLATYEIKSQGKVAELKEVSRSNFLIYSVAISEDSQYIAYMSDESGEISVLKGKDEVAKLNGIDALPNTIIFYKNYIIVGADSKKIYFFDIKNALQ